MNANLAPLALTLGDACGIGPEIVLKACAELSQRPGSPALRIYGDAGVLAREASRLGLPLPLSIEPCSALPPELPLGRIDARAGQAAYDAVVRASQDALGGRVRGVVTAPLHKEALYAAGIRHPGHTEILAQVAGVSDVRMMLVNDELRTLLVTIHIALREAIDRITLPAVLDTIRIGHSGLQRMGIARPRIAVAGLNPHAGEGGLMGREDLDIIATAITAARAVGCLVYTSPSPPD